MIDEFNIPCKLKYNIRLLQLFLTQIVIYCLIPVYLSPINHSTEKYKYNKSYILSIQKKKEKNVG